MKKSLFFALVVLTAIVPTGAFASSFVDTFDTIDSAWVTDRYEPAGFDSVVFDGDNRLRISIDDADYPSNIFYNTQGRQRDIDLFPGWIVYGDIYVSDDMIDGANLRRTDLWARASDGPEANAEYSIIGMRQFDTADPFSSTAGNITSAWRVWDADTANGWVDLSPAVTSGWHSLSIESDGASYTYRIDGSVVYTDATTNDLIVNPGSGDLTNVFLQAYNFGDADYQVYWDNVGANAPVPEPATVSLLMLGLTGFLARRRQK